MAHNQDLITTFRGTAANPSQHATKTSHQHPTLFDLPGEIRNIIYSYAIGECRVHTTCKSGSFPPRFASTNRQMRTEMLPLYYAQLEVNLGLGSQRLWNKTLQWLMVVGESARYLRIFNIFVDDSFYALGVANITLTDKVRKPDERCSAKMDFSFPYRFGDATVLEAHAWQLYYDMEHLKKLGFLNRKRLIGLFSGFNYACETLARQARGQATLKSPDN